MNLPPLTERTPVTVADNVRIAVEKALAEAWPAEGCGLLAGADDNTIDEWQHQRNHGPQPGKQFAMEPLDLTRYEKDLDRRNQALLGLVHSHPDCPAIPSETDRRYARNWPGFLWWIVRVDERRIVEHRCWQLSTDERFCERPLHFIA